MTGFGRLKSARELLPILRLDDLAEEYEEAPTVLAVVLTTHDLNLRFVVGEILPAYVEAGRGLAPGSGPVNRAFRATMLDLPPTLIVCATESAVNLDVPWRPPTLDIERFTGARLQHSKVAAILYLDEHGNKALRLVASSANLTRRAFTHNLEVAAYHDIPLSEDGRTDPSAVNLRSLLDALAAGSSCARSAAFQTVHRELSSKANSEWDDYPVFVHSADPEEFRAQIVTCLTSKPERDSARKAALVVSPFFSVGGHQLHCFWRDELAFGTGEQVPHYLVVDRRGIAGSDVTCHPDEPSPVPPAWFAEYRGPGSLDFAPATLGRKRERNGTEHAVSNQRLGRSLHAKVIGIGYSRRRTKKLIWRALIGSANFSESGLGLRGMNSNLEAGFLVEHQESQPNDRFGPAPAKEALAIHGELVDPPSEFERPEAELERATVSAAKDAFAAWAGPEGCLIEPVENGYRIRLSAPTNPNTEVFHGETRFEGESDGIVATVHGLSPYFLKVIVSERVFHWPLPTGDAVVQESMTRTAGAARRSDRLMDYWLHGGLIADLEQSEPGEYELGVGLGSSPGAVEPSDDRLGSWQTNRLLLGVRRRLVRSMTGRGVRVPTSVQLMDSIRVADLVTLAERLPQPDAAYLAGALREMFLGYRAAELDETRKRRTIEKDIVVRTWEATDPWKRLQRLIEDGRRDLPVPVIDALDACGASLYESVRDLEDEPA